MSASEAFFPQAIFISLDQDKNIASLSSAAESYLGKSLNQLQGKKLETALPKEHPLLENLERAGRFSLYDQEYYMLNSSAELFDIHQYSEDEQTHIFIYPRPNYLKNGPDRDARFGIKQTSAMASVLGHEIRNPLGAIKGAAQLLAMGAQSEDKELLKVIEEETERVGRLVNEFEEMASGPIAQAEPVNIHVILDQAILAAKAGYARDIEFTKNYDPSLPDVAVNSDQFQRALSNLLKNASEAIAEQHGENKNLGRITIQSRYHRGVKRGSVELPVELVITDNGGGMDEDILDVAFKPFVTSKSNGTGIGLAVVARMIEEVGGLIDVQNINNGCEVRMLLPIWGS